MSSGSHEIIPDHKGHTLRMSANFRYLKQVQASDLTLITLNFAPDFYPDRVCLWEVFSFRAATTEWRCLTEQSFHVKTTNNKKLEEIQFNQALDQAELCECRSTDV